MNEPTDILACTHCGALCEVAEYLGVYECGVCGKTCERPDDPNSPTKLSSEQLMKLFELANAHLEQHGDGEIMLPSDTVN